MRLALPSVACLVLASVGHAQTCGGNPGPDIVVSQFAGVSNYTALGAIDACAFGVTFTNFGTQTITVSPTTSNHPVLMENLYRYEVVNGASRFEQIGMSWALHTYFMLEDNAFCACTPTGNGKLGVGCSSPSTSTAVGAQTVQGPRSELNAFASTFPFPPSNPPYSGTIARRLQFALADVDPLLQPGAQYFVEAIVMSPGDASAGHTSNNASYAPVAITLNGSEASVALAGPIVRGASALNAWQALDPSVLVTSVQIPGEGNFVVASCATHLGTGAWHYEYAVSNLNSDRACGSLRIDRPSHANPANYEFHDVDYHDGDGAGGVNLDGTDWTASIAPSEIQWSTASFAANPNANALRAATSYSFRFDVYAAPIQRNVHLDTWKVPGTVDAVALAPDLAWSLGSYFCFGDGSGTPCPCGNASPIGADVGCQNSLALGGKLRASGASTISNDTAVIAGTDMPNSSCLYFQGSTQLGVGGSGSVFGDGLRCVGGSVVRLATKTNVAGASSYPVGADAAISVKGLVPAAGASRTYQAWYRNAAAFCSASTFNLSNGLELTWTP